jgi:hypothetical protein
MVFAATIFFGTEQQPARPIQEKLLLGLIGGTEKDGRGEDPLEALHDAVVSFSVFEKAEEVEHLGPGAETDAPALLVERQGGHPDRNQAVLAKGQAELRMPRDLEEELAVASGVEQLTRRRPAKWKPTKDERPGVEGQVLGSFLSLLSDELNGFELLEAVLSDPYGG